MCSFNIIIVLASLPSLVCAKYNAAPIPEEDYAHSVKNLNTALGRMGVGEPPNRMLSYKVVDVDGGKQASLSIDFPIVNGPGKTDNPLTPDSTQPFKNRLLRKKNIEWRLNILDEEKRIQEAKEEKEKAKEVEKQDEEKDEETLLTEKHEKAGKEKVQAKKAKEREKFLKNKWIKDPFGHGIGGPTRAWRPKVPGDPGMRPSWQTDETWIQIRDIHKKDAEAHIKLRQEVQLQHRTLLNESLKTLMPSLVGEVRQTSAEAKESVATVALKAILSVPKLYEIYNVTKRMAEKTGSPEQFHTFNRKKVYDKVMTFREMAQIESHAQKALGITRNPMDDIPPWAVAQKGGTAYYRTMGMPGKLGILGTGLVSRAFEGDPKYDFYFEEELKEFKRQNKMPEGRAEFTKEAWEHLKETERMNLDKPLKSKLHLMAQKRKAGAKRKRTNKGRLKLQEGVAGAHIGEEGDVGPPTLLSTRTSLDIESISMALIVLVTGSGLTLAMLRSYRSTSIAGEEELLASWI